MLKAKNQGGFTLIELIIVLAIAALILAGILFAVNGAQQSRRDSDRRASTGQLASLLEESAGNHDGNYPSQPGGITTAQYTVLAQGRTNAPGGGDFAYTYPAVGACPAPSTGAVDDARVMIAVAPLRQYRIGVRLESGDWFCADNF